MRGRGQGQRECFARLRVFSRQVTSLRSAESTTAPGSFEGDD